MIRKQRIMSGTLAFLICCTTILHSSMTAFAAESAKPEIQTVESAEDKAPVQEDNFILYNEGASNLPFLSEMKERLTEDEFVIAQDISIKAQTDFDIEHDFTKLFFAEEKVKIIFKNAVDEKLTNFANDVPGKYQAVYEVYPVRDENLAYQISRMITVKSREPESPSKNGHTKTGTDSGDESEDADPSVAPDKADMNQTGEPGKPDLDDSADNLDTSGGENEQELVVVEDVEDSLFLSVVPARMAAQRSSNVSLVKGKTLRYPSNIGNYETNYFYVNGKIAYCLESPKASSPDADYVAEVLNTNANLQKVLYYGYGGPGDLTEQYMPYLGKYRIVETKAPADLVIEKNEQETTKTVSLTYAGQTASLALAESEYNNKRPKIKVTSVKHSQNDDTTLEGAKFGLYSKETIKINGRTVLDKDTLIQSSTSNRDGIAEFTADIPINYTYYIREIQAPEKYYMSDETYEFTYTYKNDQTYEYVFSHGFQNEEVRAKIHVRKIDKETHEFLSQGDAALIGAEYGLFAAEDIQHPNKKSGTVHKKGELVSKEKINENGELDFTDLYLGKYCIRELVASEGYLLDPTEYPVEAAYEGQDVKIVHREVTVNETVKKQPFQLIKVGSDGEQTEADLLKGAGFKIYLIRSLKGVKAGDIKPDGNGNYSPEQFRGYDFSKETTALDYSEDSKGIPMPELFTDEKGYAVSNELAYGKYVVIESTTPENYNRIDPFIVTINEDKREPQQWRVFIDYEFQAILKIYKIDGTSKMPVLHKGTVFKIYNLDNEEYVKQYTHYPELVEHTEFEVSDQGYLLTPEKLKMGNYRLEEIAAADGYVKGEPIEFTLSSDQAYEVEDETGAVVIRVDYENQRQTGSLRLQKKGERLSGYGEKKKNILRRFGEFLGILDSGKDDSDFIYEMGNVEGAEFKIYAAEDIYSPDYQCDREGNRITLYRKDELVSMIKTDKDGKAELTDLPLGKYKIEEVTAGPGFVLNKEIQEFLLEYAGDEVEVAYSDSEYVNERQRVSIQIKKTDIETKNPVAGTIFGLYTAEDILIGEGIVIPADTLIETVFSDENGVAAFTKDLPIAHYYAKELKPSPGYVQSEELIDFNLQYTNQEQTVIVAEQEVTNDFTKVDISKVDIGGKEVIGAKLTIKDSDGNEVTSWITDGKVHRIDRLAPGDYILIEEQAPDGYELAEEIPFTVLESGEILKVEMVDEFEKTGTITIDKVGDMLTGISTYDSDFGKINRMEYEKRSLPGVEFTVYDMDGNALDTITTDEEGKGVSKNLPLGEYILKETKTPAGLAMNHKKYEVVLTKDKKDQVVDIILDIENDVIDTEINVYKVGEMLNPENETFGYGKKPLEGIFFGIYTNEVIKDYCGESILLKDSLIGVIKTNEEGKATLKAALVSGHYYFKELQTLEGYILNEEKHDFELTLENEPVTVFDINKENPAVNKLEKAKVTLIKIDANNESKKLPGAEFELFTADGKNIGTYITDEKGEINISDLAFGEYYFKEKKAPAGYQQLADKIEFRMKGQDITITCRNHVIPKTAVPKLGFDDSTALFASAFVAVGITGLGIGFSIYFKKQKRKK